MDLIFIGAMLAIGISLIALFYIYYKLSENESKYKYYTSYLTPASAPLAVGSRIS